MGTHADLLGTDILDSRAKGSLPTRSDPTDKCSLAPREEPHSLLSSQTDFFFLTENYRAKT